MGTINKYALSAVRDNVGKTNAFNLRDRRAIWIAYHKDSNNFANGVKLSEMYGKDYETSWEWYGEEVVHHTRPLEQNHSYEYHEGQIVTNPYVENGWQIRWVINRIEEASYSRMTQGHSRRRHSRYSRSAQYDSFWSYTSYKKAQHRAW